MTKLLFISLGCDKNLVDSEKMLGLIRKKSYALTDDETQADVIVINTCCFIHDAKEESINTILEMARQKEKGCLKALIVAGCLGQRYPEEIRRELPEVDAVVGTTALEDICAVIESVLGGEKAWDIKEPDYLPEKLSGRVITTGGYYSYLKIAEGCDKRCTYCIIPKIRGKYRSIPMERLLEEARELVGQGVAELNLVAQETTLYGADLYGRKMLPELLRELCGIEGLRWIRLLYCYPEEITPELIDVIAREDKICKYLDIPIQHASDAILKRMGRKTTQAQLCGRIRELRERIPAITLRTTLITGFPGETEADFQTLLDFVEKTRFDRLGVFPYSPEEDTPAAAFEGQLADAVKEARRDRVMELQQQIALEQNAAKVGTAVPVLIEGRLPEEEVYVGRTPADAPGVDGYIFVPCSHELLSGQIVTARITGAREYDLYGELQETP